MNFNKLLNNQLEICEKYSNKFYSNNNELLNNINLEKYNNKQIVEPFYGNGDLVKNILSKNIEKYDIKPDTEPREVRASSETADIILQNTLLNPPDYNNKYVITNPPYTAKNKLSQQIKDLYKEYFDKPYINDLYQIFLIHLISSNCIGGILILPINFLFGKESNQIRELFKNKYNILIINIFEKQVFTHTKQAIITIEFEKKIQEVKTIYNYYNNKESIENFKLIDYNLRYKNIKHKICRNYNIKNMIPSNIVINLIDNTNSKIHSYISDNIISDKISDRTRMSICFDKIYTIEEQYKIVDLFNQKLNKIRDKTHSLIFSSYREFSRKRLTFNEAFIILSNVLNKLNQ